MLDKAQRKLALAVLGMASIAPALTQAGPAQFTGSPLEGVNIEAIQELPMGGFKAVKADGQLFFISDSGRFVFRGELYDVWNTKKLDTMEAVLNATSRIQFSNFNIDPNDDLGAFTYGEGDKEVVVFVDPNCPYCHELLNSLEQAKDDYKFSIVMIPVMGNDSGKRVRSIGCATDRNEAFGKLISGSAPYGLEQVENCDLKPFQKALVTAKMFGVQGVPFIIAPDGRLKRGNPKNLKAFLEGDGA